MQDEQVAEEVTFQVVQAVLAPYELENPQRRGEAGVAELYEQE